MQYKYKLYKKIVRSLGQAAIFSLLKWLKTCLVPNICHIKIMINIRKLTVMNISG